MGKKQTSIYFEDNLLEALKIRSDKENLKMNDFVVRAVEKQILFPFVNWRHLYNYLNILNHSIRKTKYDEKNRNAFLYCLAYDGMYMHYFDEICKYDGKGETINIPKELDNLLVAYSLIDAAIELKQGSPEAIPLESCLDFFDPRGFERHILFNAISIMEDVISIKNDLYKFHNLNPIQEITLKDSYTTEEYINTPVFSRLSNNIKEIILELFSILNENNMNITIKPSKKDIHTFVIYTTTNKRLAIVSPSCEEYYLKIGLDKIENKAKQAEKDPTCYTGFIYYTSSIYEVRESTTQDLIYLYKQLIKS